MYQSNAFISAEPYYLFSSRDYFFKSAKVFGEDCAAVAAALRKAGVPFREDLLHGFLQFSPESIMRLTDTPELPVLLTSHIAEADEQGNPLIKEVRVEFTTPAEFSPDDIHGGMCEQ